MLFKAKDGKKMFKTYEKELKSNENAGEGMLESLHAIGLFITPILLILPFIILKIIDIIFAYYVIYAIYILGTIAVLKLNDKKLQDIGISTKGLGESLGGSILYVSIVIIIIAAKEGMQLKTGLTLFEIVEQGIYNFIFSGIGQEILFRGLILFSIWRWKGWKVALVISSVLFGFVHIIKGLSYVFVTMIHGFIYGYLVYQTKNIIGPTAAHGLYNFVLGFLLVRV
jgi:membrane protease YdiL (CAAX protease family)